MIRDILKKYKWYLITIVSVYVVVSLWLFFFTNSPQSVPFVYQVN